MHGFACVTHHGNQVVSGMALNIALSGLTVVLGYAWFHEGGQTPLLAGGRALRAHRAPRAPPCSRGVPVIGLLYREVVSGHNVLVYIAAVAVPVVAWLVYRTRFGLRLRAVGESPGAVDTAGISVAATRYRRPRGERRALRSVRAPTSRSPTTPRSSATCRRARGTSPSPR